MDNLNLVRKIAWNFHYKTHLNRNDLFQEAYLAYYKAMKTYDPSKGNISTYVYSCISSKLKNYAKLEKKYQEPLCSLDEILSLSNIYN